jgi:hypothetical protein
MEQMFRDKGTKKIEIKNEHFAEITIDKIPRNTTLYIYNCTNCIISVLCNVSKLFIDTCTNIHVTTKKVYTGIEMVHSKCITLNCITPFVQLDMSKIIKIVILELIQEFFVIYHHTLETTIDYTHYHYDCWDEFFNRQIVTHIDSIDYTFRTMAIPISL